MTTTQLTLLLLGLALLCLALLCILYKWFTNREAEDKERPGTHLEEVLVDGGRGDVPGSQPIFTVTSSYNEILSEDREELNEITPVHGKISEGVEATEDKKENRIVYLSNQAIKRHIYPNCRGDKDAERFSARRNKSSQTFREGS